jgi:hypothetical protein
MAVNETIVDDVMSVFNSFYNRIKPPASTDDCQYAVAAAMLTVAYFNDKPAV